MGSSLPAFPLTFVPSPFLPYFAADNNTPTAPKLEWKLIMDSDEGNDWLWNREDARALREKLEGVGLEEGASPRSMNSSRKVWNFNKIQDYRETQNRKLEEKSVSGRAG